MYAQRCAGRCSQLSRSHSYGELASNAPTLVTNTATVSGGGETNTTNDAASNATTILQVPDLTITKTHTGNFTQGQVGATIQRGCVWQNTEIRGVIASSAIILMVSQLILSP